MLLLSLDVVKEEKKGDDARRLDAALKSWHALIIPNWVGVTEDSHYFKSPGDVESIQTLIEDRRDLPYTGHPTSSATDPGLGIDEIYRVRKSSTPSTTDP